MPQWLQKETKIPFQTSKKPLCQFQDTTLPIAQPLASFTPLPLNMNSVDPPEELETPGETASLLPNPIELSGRQDENIVSPLVAPISVEDSALADAVIARNAAYRAQNRKASWWGFYELVEKDTFACQICAPCTQNISARNKKDKKGLLHYNSASGSTSLWRHVDDHHPKEHAKIKKRFAERGTELLAERVPKMARKVSTLQGVFASQKKSSDNYLSQLCFNRDIILMVAESALPPSIVDNRYFPTAILRNNPNKKIPSRRSLCDVLIPNFIKDVYTRYVIPKLISMETVAISFDHCMSRGCQHIFDLIFHGIDANFKRH